MGGALSLRQARPRGCQRHEGLQAQCCCSQCAHDTKSRAHFSAAADAFSVSTNLKGCADSSAPWLLAHSKNDRRASAALSSNGSARTGGRVPPGTSAVAGLAGGVASQPLPKERPRVAPRLRLGARLSAGSLKARDSGTALQLCT